MKLRVDKSVLTKAETIVKENEGKETFDLRPMPVVLFFYPRHGVGTAVPRFVRITEADTKYIRGFQIRHEYDEEPGAPKTFERAKILGPVEFLHLAPVTE